MKCLGRSIAILLAVVLFYSCGGADGMDGSSGLLDPPFAIKDAYIRQWLGGTREAGRGWEFFVKLDSLQTDVRLDSVYYGSWVGALKQRKDDEHWYVATMRSASGRTLVMDSEPYREAANLPEARTRFKMPQGEAMLLLYRNGKYYHTRIRDVREEPPISYPGEGPVNRQ